MTDQEMRAAMERADGIVAKMRSLVALEDKVLAAREALRELSATNGASAPAAHLQADLTGLESQLKERVTELNTITEELQLTTPCFRAYVLPQMSEIMGTLKACDTAERAELAELITALTDEDTETTDQLEQAIIARLKNNLERTFRTT